MTDQGGCADAVCVACDGIQPAPNVGKYVAVLEPFLGKEAALPRRKRRLTQRLFEELPPRGYDGAHDSVASLRQSLAVVSPLVV